ncbi:MAG: hypothetical protein ACYC5X_17660, partial [Syntrophales bacterium]
NQSAICVGFVIRSSAYDCIRRRHIFLAALISSLIWNRNKTWCENDREHRYSINDIISVTNLNALKLVRDRDLSMGVAWSHGRIPMKHNQHHG